MFEELFSDEATRRRHRNAPFANERERYLRHCANLGGTRATLRSKSTTLLWLSSHLEPSASEGIGLEQLQKIAQARQSIYNGATTARRLIDIARPGSVFWLVARARCRVPFSASTRSLCCLDAERGFSPLTIERWQAHARMFLQWCEQTGRHLSALQPSDIDHYFVSEGTGRWSRVSVCGIASGLRAFLRFAASQAACDPGLANAIQGPRRYQQEALPMPPAGTMSGGSGGHRDEHIQRRS